MKTSLKVIKLSAIDSTNDYLKSLGKKVDLQDGVVVVAREQTRGKGQMAAKWHSEGGKSLSFSLLRRFSNFSIEDQFAINWAISLGILKGLQCLDISELAIKWPNDILAGGKKLCGILIENQLQGSQIICSVIGVGVNVNNDHFPDLPQATSMALHAGMEFDLEQVLQYLLEGISSELDTLKTTNLKALKKRYEHKLFRINTISAFETPNGDQWNAIIKGVSKEGELQLERENAVIQEFKLKEIRLLY